MELPEEFNVNASPELLKDLKELLGGPNYKIKANMEVPKPKPRFVPRDRQENAEAKA